MSETESDCNTSDSSDKESSETNNLDLHGKIIGNYNIIYKIGSGGYSIVWLAYNIGNNKYYALKVQYPRDFKDGYE